jgi:hypothetical protein
MLRRPHRVAPLIESLTASGADARALFICSADDLETREAVDASGADNIVVDWPGGTPGDYARKINAGYQASTEPYLFTGADDLHFHKGWLDAALWHRPAQVIGTNDLGNERVVRGDHSTHTLVRRRYIDRCGLIDEPGKVLFEGYQHEFCDDELVGTAKKRGVWAFAFDAHVEHLHAHYLKAPMDDIYAAQGDRMNASRKLFTKRQRLWT